MLKFLPAIRNNACSFHRLYNYTPRRGIYVYNYYQRPPMPQGALDFNAGPLVWIDCEMTGLNPQKDKIIEIAVR
jgi:oligoribonuclease